MTLLVFFYTVPTRRVWTLAVSPSFNTARNCTTIASLKFYCNNKITKITRVRKKTKTLGLVEIKFVQRLVSYMLHHLYFFKILNEFIFLS